MRRLIIIAFLFMNLCLPMGNCYSSSVYFSSVLTKHLGNLEYFGQKHLGNLEYLFI